MADEDEPDELLGERLREDTAAHGEPPPKPSLLDAAKQRVSKSVDEYKSQRAAAAEERKEIEAEKKAAIEQAKMERKQEATAKEIQNAYENERYRRSPTEKIAAGIHALQPFLSGMKQGITSIGTPQAPQRGKGGLPSNSPFTFSGSGAGFDITQPQRYNQFQGSSGRLAILDQPQGYSTPKRQGRQARQVSALDNILFGKPARAPKQKGRTARRPVQMGGNLFGAPSHIGGTLFGASKMGVNMPAKGSLFGLNMPKAGRRKGKSIFGY